MSDISQILSIVFNPERVAELLDSTGWHMPYEDTGIGQLLAYIKDTPSKYTLLKNILERLKIYDDDIETHYSHDSNRIGVGGIAEGMIDFFNPELGIVGTAVDLLLDDVFQCINSVETYWTDDTYRIMNACEHRDMDTLISMLPFTDIFGFTFGGIAEQCVRTALDIKNIEANSKA